MEYRGPEGNPQGVLLRISNGRRPQALVQWIGIQTGYAVGFLVRKGERLEGIVISSTRLISICIAARPQNITIIQVYAPPSTYDDLEMEDLRTAGACREGQTSKGHPHRDRGLEEKGRPRRVPAMGRHNSDTD